MRRAFTVPELLAVVAIILIILSILLPVIQKGTESSREVRCAVNMRSLQQASLGYATENSQWMVFPNWLAQEDGPPPDWQSAGWLYKYPNRTNFEDHHQGQLWNYIRDDNSYRCPVDKPPYKPGSTHMITSYLLNGAFSGFGSAPHHVYRRFQFKADSMTFWEADEKAGSGAYNDGSSFPSEPVTQRHITGLTVASHDGHTEWLTYVEYQAVVAENPGRLWCKP